MARNLLEVAPFEYNTPIFFGSGGEGERAKLTGWAQTEPGFTWSDGIAASLAVRVPPTEELVQLHFRICGMNVPERVHDQRVDLYVNSEKLARWRVSDEQVYTVTVPEKFVSQPDPLLIIDFYVPEAISPVAAGAGSDLRRLGVRLAELIVSSTPHEAAVRASESVPRSVTWRNGFEGSATLRGRDLLLRSAIAIRVPSRGS